MKNAVQPGRVLAGTLVGSNRLQWRPSERPRELALIVDRRNEVVVAFHLHRRAGRPPLVYHRGVKAISTLVVHSPGEYGKVRLGSGERILISTSQQSVRISKLWFGVLPVTTIYDRSKKDLVALEKALMTIMTWPATQGPDICGRILSRVLKECESVSDIRLLFKEV